MRWHMRELALPWLRPDWQAARHCLVCRRFGHEQGGALYLRSWRPR